MHVYKIINKANGKIYIGKDSSSDHHRWYYHRWAHNKAHVADYQKLLYRAIRKYGIENFEYEVLENCENPIDLCEVEKKWIVKLKSTNHDIGYNVSGETGAPRKSRKIYIAKSSLGVIYTIDSVAVFCSQHGFLPKRFYDVACGRKRQYKGWQFVEAGNEFPILGKRRSSPRRGMKHTKKRLVNSKTKRWTLVKPDGNTIEIENLKLFCESNHLSYRAMLKVSSRQRPHHKGWTIRDRQPVQKSSHSD